MAKLGWATIAALWAPLMFGQFQSTSSRSNGNSVEISFSAFNSHYAPAFTGAPYCADEVSEHVQTLADGTHISQNPTVTHTCRDSQGRVRTERPLIRAPFGTNYSDVTLVEIRDPVGGSFYILDASNKTAHRLAIPTEPAAQQTARGPATMSVPLVRSSAPVPGTRSQPVTLPAERLTAQMMEGVMAEGTRNTTTYPIGSVGNDRPIVAIGEMWFSKELGLTVLSKNSDPRNGEQTTRLTNISRAEPQMSLFQPPPDYKIVEETGGFTMTMQRQEQAVGIAISIQ